MENDLTGKLSPDGLDSAAKEGNATFKKQYVQESLVANPMTPEALAQSFSEDELKKKTIPAQPDVIPQGDLTTPIDIPAGEPIIPDKTEPAPIDQVYPPVQEDIPNPINDTKLQTDQLYVNDLARMANTIGVGKKYTPEAIKSNIDNPKFLDELFKQLDNNPRTAGEATDLRDTKHQRLLNEVSARLGFVPSTGKMSTPELEKTIGQMDQDINTVKQWTVKQNLTYPEAMKTGEITDGMAKAFEGGPDVAFKYFTDKIKDNPDLNPYYKGLVANSLHEQMIKASTETGLATNDEIFANLTSLSEFDAKTKVVSDFKKNNENGFLAGQALQVDKNEVILKKMLPLIDDMYKVTSAKLDQTIAKKVDKTNDFGFSDTGILEFANDPKLQQERKDKDLARNAQIMLKDMERLILQFRNPNIIGDFKNVDPGSMSTSEKLLTGIATLGTNNPGEKFEPGKIPLGIAQGVKSPLWNVESLLPLIPIIKKYQDGKDLTDVEQLALNSFSALNTAQGTIPKTFAFEFGESVYTNVQFMATLMAASPLYEGVFKVVEHSVEKGLKVAAQKEIGDMVVSKIAGGLTKSLANVTKGWLPELSGMVVGNLPVVFTQPMFYNEIVSNLIGQGPTIANFDNLNANQTDVFRNLKIDASQALKSSPLRSTWDAFRHTFVEDFTENLGAYGDKGLDLLANKVSGKYGKWFTGGATNSVWRQKARLNGILMENMEEWIGAPLNWILGDDTETLKQQFTPRSLAMIAASVGVFTVPGYAMSKYQVYKGNKAVTELSDQAQVSIGLNKWKAFQEGLKQTNTLNSRAGFVQDFIQKNTLTNEQVDMAVKYAGIATANEIRNGAMTKAGMNAGRGDYQSLADLKLQNKLDKKSELLDLVESNPKTKEAYDVLLEEYKGKIINPNMTPDEVNKNFRQAFKDLLLHPEINAQASEITKKFNKIVEEAGIQTEIQKIEKEYKTRLDALRTPEEVSTDQMVQHEMNLAAQEHRKTVEKRVKGEIQGMTSSQLTERHTPIQTLIGTATSPQLRIEQIDKQLESKDFTPEKITELNGLKNQLSKMSEERFNELKYERNYVANINNIVAKQEQDDHIRSLVKTMSSGFIDQQGHVNTSLNHSSTIQDAFNAEDEFNRQMNAGELTDETRTKLSEAIGEIKRRYWPGLNDKKGVQITEVTDETVKPGMKVMLQSNLLGVGNDRIKIAGEVKDVNTKNGTALIEITASNGEKSEVVFNQKMGNSGLWNLFENQNQEQQSLGQPTKNDSFTHKGKVYIFNQAKLDLYQKERQDLTNRVRYFKTEGLANEALAEHRKRWGSNVLGRVTETDTHKFVLRMSNPLLGTDEVLTDKTKLDRLRLLNQSLIELSTPFNNWKYDNRSDEEKSNAALEFQSADEMLQEINDNARNFNHESKGVESDHINTEIERAKILRVMDILSRITGVRWNVVEGDPKGEGRHGWTKGREYFVNMQKAKLDTPIHEYAHPIMDAIEIEFPTLFNNLYKKLEQSKDPRLKSIIESVNASYDNLTTQQKKKEAIVTALGLEGELRMNLDMSPFAQVIYKIGNAIRNWLQETLGIGGLTVNTTLGELSKMIVTGRIRVGEAKTNIEHEAKGNEVKINPSEYTNHSGGAIGADSMWDKIGREFGFNNHNHYWANSRTPLGNTELTNEQLQEGISHAKDSAKVLGRPWNDQYANLLGRNWFQVKNSTQVLAVAPLIKSGERNSKGFISKAVRITVDGGTGYAVEMGIANGKSVYVFDTKSNQWFQWNGTDFIQTDTPVLDKNFAGIGSRQDNGTMTPESIQAIKDVYEKTLTGRINQIVSQQPIVPSKKIETKSGFVSIDRAMTTTYEEFMTLMESNADLSKYEMIQKAIVAGRKVYMTSPMYLGELDNSRRQMQLDIFENMMHKMLKKKKIVTDDEGKSVEMDNFEGPAATSEDKFEQFKSGFSKVVSALSKKTTLTKDVIERNLVDMTKPEFYIQNRKGFNNLAFNYTDENHINIANAITDTMVYEDYISLQNFYGSVHFEEQYGIELSMVNGEMKAIDYKQSVSATDSSLHSVFDEHIKSMNQHDLVRISQVYDDFRKFNTSRIGNFIINQEFLDKTRNMLMVLTGLNTEVIDAYLSSTRLVGDKLLYYKNEKFIPVPYGSNLTQLLGERLYYRDKFGKEQPFKYIPVLSAFGFEVHNNGDKISKQIIQSLFNKKKGGYSNIDIILMAHAKSDTTIGMSGTDIEGNRFGTMTLAHQLYNQSLKLVDKLKNAVMQSYYKENPMKIQKFNGFRNTETGNNFTGTKLDGDALWFGLVYMYRNGGQKDYQHFLGQFSDKTSVYTGNAPKWEGKTNWSKASQFNSNLLKDAQYIEKLINQYRTELSFEETDTEGMKDLARDFAVSFSINSGNILPALHGTRADFIDKTTKKFSFDDMIKRAQVVISPGYQIVTEVEGGLKSKLRYVIANEKLIKTLQGIDHKILDGLNFMSEDASKRAAVSMGSVFSREKEFGGVDMIKGVVTGVDENRILIKSNILNIGVLKGLYGENDIHTQIADYMFQHKIDVLSFPSSAKKYDKSKETALFNKTDQNLNKIIPNVIEINLNDFYVQQDLRHDIKVSPYDLPNQLYSNIVTLNSFKDMIVQISHLSANSHDFANKMFSGFKDTSAIQQYLLMNTDVDKDGQDFYDMVSNWSVSDPAFRAKLTSKLINLVNRDVLELNVPRQSSTEIPDTEGRLLGLRKDTQGHVLLPEIGVNIPGIRYAKDKFKTYEEAVQWMQSNDRKLLDLKNNDGSLQLWQIYQDEHTGNWIVPGQPILSTRVPAGDLHSHTVARARYKINSTSALTMIDMQSQINSGSDNDGDARYNWVLTNEGDYIVNDDSYHGSVNKLLLNMVNEYQSVDNFDKISNPINTGAFDTIIEDIMRDYHNPDQIDENNENSILSQSLSRKKNMTGYNLKGIMSNLTSSFSYLKAFNVKDVVEDKYNVVKAALENILNLAFDNAKDPKIEKLGINEATAQMFVYELITNKLVDKAKNREDAQRKVDWIIKKLAQKYSPYSSTKNSILSEYQNLTDTENKNLKREKKSSVLDQLRQNHLIENDKWQMVPDPNYNVFMETYSGGQSLELIGRIRKIRDGLPNRLSDFMSLKNTMMEFVHGKNGQFQHFFFEDNLYGQNTNNPVFDPNYKAFSLARNIFSLNPGSDVINHLSELFTNSFDVTNALTDSPRSKKRLKSNFELSSLASMADFEYLMKLRDQSYAKTESLLTNESTGIIPVYQRAKNLTPEERATKQSYIANDNKFLDLLDLDRSTFTDKAGNKKTTTKIKVNSYTGNTKLSPEDLLVIQQDFAKLPFNLRRVLAYYTIVNYGTTSSLRGGGFFGLIDPQSRIDFAQLQYTTPENAAMSMLLYKQMEAEIKRYADQSAGIAQTEEVLDEYGDLEEVVLSEKALKNLRTILREEKLDLNSEAALAAQSSFTGLLDMLNGTISTDARFEQGLIPYMNRLGIKSREELVQALKKIKSSDLNMKYQFNVRDKGTSITMQDPALFAFMFDHFKKTYPELSVFNNVQEFLDFIQKNTGRTMDFNLDAIGAAFANAVYINDKTAQQDTFFHEHAHIYWDAMPVDSKEKNRLRSLYGWTSSMNSQERERIDEMIIQDIGVVGTGRTVLRFEGNRLGLFLDYLRQFWNQVRSMFSLTQKSRKQAEMYFLQQIVADQVWSGGKYQSEIANNEMMHYQNGVTGDYWGTGILDIGHKGIDYSTIASLEMSQSDIFENKRLEAEQSIENIEKQIQQNEINFVQLDKIDANVFVSDNSRMYYRLEDGRVLRLDNEQKVLDRESLTDQIMQREERFSIRHAAIANMVQWAAEGKILQQFKFDNEEVYLGDLFSDPITTFEQIKTIVQNTIHEQFGVSKIEIGKVVYDDQAKHLAQMDLVGRINPQGDMIMVKFLPTIHSLEVEPGRFSPEYTNTHGRFRPNTPLEKVPNNLEQKVKNTLSQFAYMYNEMAKQNGEQKQITRSVVVPLILTEEGMHVTNVKEESIIEYNYTLQDKLLAQEVLQFATNDKMFNQAFNPVSEQELAEYKMQKRATAQEQDFADTQAKGPHIVAAFTARSGNVLSTWNVAVNSNLGHGSWLNTALNQLGWKSFMVTNKKGENKSSTKQRDFTLSKLIKGKLNDDGSPRGSILYMSPGSGKTFATENHVKLYDSDEILERSLLTGYYDYLAKDSETAKALHIFSDSHPLLKTPRLFGKGSDSKTVMTFKSILDDYQTGKISLNLFAFQMSSLIHELRMIAARELKVDSSGSKEQMRSETSELSGEAVDMIRLNTPYEVLAQRIEDANKAGYHVLTSTLMHPEFKHLIDLSFDSVHLLRDDVKQKKGFGLMQYRTMSHQRKNVIAASDQKWNETRYKLENETFASNDNVHYTDRYATDVLFEQPFHSFKEKIAGLKSLYAIEKLGISYTSYRQKLDQSFNESIVNGDQQKAQENLSLTMEEFIGQKWKERFPNYDENGRTAFSYAQLETLMKNNNLSGDPYSLLGFLHNGGISEEQVVDKFIDNISQADKLWEEVGTMESFADRFDYTNAKTDADKMFMRNSLIELMDRIKKLDLFNGEGLMHLVTSQNAINDLLAAVELESKEGGVNRPNTTLLGKILTHPDFKWIPGVDYEKMMFYKMGLHKIFKPQGKIGRLFKLDRLIDKRHTLLQQLMIRQQVTHNTIVEESNTTMQDLSSKFRLFSELDKNLMTYKYGEKTEDKISSMWGRTAYISRDEALDLRKSGQLSQPAFDYLEQLREQFDKYDFKYHKQTMKYGDNVPMFMPDVQAQLEPMSVAEFVSQDSEFARLVNTYYGLDVNGPTNRKFRRELYDAMNVSGEDSFVVQTTASTNTGQSPDGKTYDELKDFKQFDGMTFADVKRVLFDPAYIGKTDVMKRFESSIDRLEKIRNMVSKTATAKYMKKERTLHQSGAFNKGMILRTEMFHEANLIYLNSLISNFHTKTLAPFAQFVEDRYKSDAAKSVTYNEAGKPQYHDNYMQDYITSYIDERVFKHTPEDMVQFKKVHRIVGSIVSLAGLGLNLGGAIGNFTAGQMQNFMGSPDAYWKGFKRLEGFTRLDRFKKAINIMHHSNVGMVVDDVTFKRSEKFMEGLMRTGMFFTTNVEDVNQGILFLGLMTDEELSWYGNDGIPLDPNKKMSHFRTIQIENELRRIHGDYGHNRPLYGANPWLMEMGRFKMGWMQTLLNDYWGGTSVDIFNQEHRSVRQSVFNAYNRFIVHASTTGFNGEARMAKKMKMLENVLNSGGTDDVYARLKDSVEESVESVYDGMEHRSALEYRTFPLEISDPNDPTKMVKKWITITDNDYFTTKAKMVIELMLDHEQQKNFLNKDRVDSENYRRLGKMVGTSTLATIGAAMAYMTMMGLMSGAGGDPEKKEMSWEDWGNAFAYGFKSEGILGSLKKVLSGQTATSLKDDQSSHPLTSFSSFSPEVWRGIARMKMFMNFGKQINSDILIPYNPVQLGKFVTPSAAATAGMVTYAFMLGGSIASDIFHGELQHFQTINLQAGYNTEMTQTPFYLRKVLPMKWMFQWMYNQQHVGENWQDGIAKGIEYSLFSYPSQQMFEDSQIFLRTMSQMNSLYDLAVGAGDITPEQIPELSKVVQQMVKAKYYSNLEWQKAQGMQPIIEMKDKGKYQINRKQREKIQRLLHGQ